MAVTIEFNGEFWQKAESDCGSHWKKGEWICVWGWADLAKEKRREAMANR